VEVAVAAVVAAAVEQALERGPPVVAE